MRAILSVACSIFGAMVVMLFPFMAYAALMIGAALATNGRVLLPDPAAWTTYVSYPLSFAFCFWLFYSKVFTPDLRTIHY